MGTGVPPVIPPHVCPGDGCAWCAYFREVARVADYYADADADRHAFHVKRDALSFVPKSDPAP